MRKRVFSKYVTAFMLIITFGFVLLLLIVTTIVSNHSELEKSTLLRNTARLEKLYLESTLETGAPGELFVTEEMEEMIFAILFELNPDDRDTVAWIADPDGAVLASIGESSELMLSGVSVVLPNKIMNAVERDGVAQQPMQLADFSHEIQACAMELRNGRGEMCGVVAILTVNTRRMSIVEDLTQTVITSALLVLLATFIAAYFLTERIADPLRRMSVAAGRFASGQFDTRVQVDGHDEVAELAEAFNKMADSLENLETMRNSFVANVSHDLRTPMTTIAGFIDSIRDGVIPPEEVDHYLDVISEEVHRLSRLVSSLLDLSRIQAGDRKFIKKPFDICEMARLILISFEQKIEEKRLAVEFFCEEDRMSVYADRDAVYQVFYNICHNAVKFSCEGGAFRIHIQYTREKKVQVSVFNEGQGIPANELPMVFERFYKTDKSRGLDRSGAGLGLFIAKTIMKAQGEDIRVRSEEGKNCEFLFTLTRVPHGLEEAELTGKER